MTHQEVRVKTTKRSDSRRLLVGVAMVCCVLASGEGLGAPFDSAAGAKADVRLAEVLKEARASLETSTSIAFDVQALDFSGDPKTALPFQKSVASLRFRGVQFEALCTTYIMGEDGEMAPNMKMDRYWDGERSWQKTGVASQIPEVETKAIVGEDRAAHQRLLFAQDGGAFIDGRFLHNHNGDWIDILQDEDGLALGEQTEVVDGHECVTINAATDHGTYRLWLDPLCGYRIRRATIIVESNDIAWGTVLSESPYHAPHHSIVKIELEISDVSIAEIDGQYVSTGGQLLTRKSYDDGEVAETTKVIQRTNIQVAPDFQAMDAFRVRYPEGTRVEYTYEDSTRLHYIWNGKELVLDINHDIVRAIENSVPELEELAQL